jgi:serine phosphatase RsbU (regulator of sigma subunit)
VIHTTLEPDPQPSAPSAAAPQAAPYDWRTLVAHAQSVEATEPTDTAFDRFKKHGQEFMAVIEKGRPVGICARREIGMLLGGRYGYALHARKPVRSCMSPGLLCIEEGMAVDPALAAVFSREATAFYDDVALVDGEGAFVGLIPVHALVRLQTTLREAHVRELQAQRREIAARNDEMETDLALAREMQLALLPRQFPAFPPGAETKCSTLRFAHGYLPSQGVSGDFFYVLPLDHRRAAMFICDVMGHGVRSALVTAMLRVLAQEAAMTSMNTGLMLERVNRGLMEIIPHETGMMFVTAAYAIVDVAERTMEWSSAGHPAPVLLRRGAGMAELLKLPRGDFNPALGIFPNATYHTYRRALDPADVLFFFTDGLFEVEDAEGEQLGLDGLLADVQALAGAPLSELVGSILSCVRSYSTRGFEDDVCLLAAELDAGIR